MNTRKKTVLITGASSGIGKAVTRQFEEQGWNVIATMRDPEKEQEIQNSANVLLARLDVQNPDSIQHAIDTGIERFGRIDLLVNNAGYGQYGIFEAITPEQIQKQFEINVFGVMNVTRAILPHFRQYKEGSIINVSSGGGRIALPLISLYVSSKFALEGFSEALSYELKSQNISVKIVEPGGVSTNFHQVTHNEFANSPGLNDYDQFLSSMNMMFDQMRSNKLLTVEEVSAEIYNAATDGTDRLRYTLGDDILPLIHARNSMNDEEYMDFMRSKFSIS